MKRLIVCGVVLGALLGVVWYSGHCMDDYAAALDGVLQQARQAAQAEQTDAAAQLLQAGIETAREREHRMAFFVRREAFAELDETLQAAWVYAQCGNSEETLAELARAESQLYSMRHLFSQVV